MFNNEEPTPKCEKVLPLSYQFVKPDGMPGRCFRGMRQEKL
jgi:hypothetical protein